MIPRDVPYPIHVFYLLIFNDLSSGFILNRNCLQYRSYWLGMCGVCESRVSGEEEASDAVYQCVYMFWAICECAGRVMLLLTACPLYLISLMNHNWKHDVHNGSCQGHHVA